ncbi:hypothetical protein [Pseudomonas putida]|uniref:hypothetical protein n=1 Tax=Pseudomonas putida TaxID=303 RepID=UPI003824232B
MRYIYLILTAALLGGCGKYNAVDTLSDAKPDSRDIGLCGGGLGIDNQVGLIIRSEAEKSGGELSASQRSKIQASAVDAGILSTNDNYETYVKCILELNNRRGDTQTLNLQKRLQQPALKVWRQGYEHESSYVRRLVIENTGEELTELQVTQAPFLVISGMCTIDLAREYDKKKCRDLPVAYIPLENYYSLVTWVGAYTGELYSVDEAPDGMDEVVKRFAGANALPGTLALNDNLVLLVRVRYKDKFQETHERFFDVTFTQIELEADLGQALFASRDELLQAGLVVDVRRIAVSRLLEVWSSLQQPRSELPTFWQRFEKRRSEV